MILIFVTLRPFAVNTLTTLTAVALWCLHCHCRPLSLPLPHAGEVVESDPGVEALGDASRPHPGAGVSLPREYRVLLEVLVPLTLYFTYLYLLVMW